MRFLLTMRREDDSWDKLSKDEQQAFIQRYFAWVDTLKPGGYHGGAPIKPRLQELRHEVGELTHKDSEKPERPLSGYFIFEAADWDAARALAAGCPALEHNETLELRQIVEMGDH